MKILKSERIDEGKITSATLQIVEDDNSDVYIERIVDRNGVKTKSYTQHLSDGSFSKLTFEIASSLIQSLMSGEKKWSDLFATTSSSEDDIKWTRTPQEHKFTSTGIKFWRHQESMENFRLGKGNTVISTHISPEGMCNLKCSYCSVTYRDTASRISLPRIKEYVTQLKQRGLKAVILTGGGEPTLYPHFNELVLWLKSQNLSIGLITNGTQTKRISDEAAKCFSWVRVSVNIFTGWEKIIKLDRSRFSQDCVVGCSFVYTAENMSGEDMSNLAETFRRVSAVATNVGADYIRVLPNCLLEQENLIEQHKNLKKIFQDLNDTRYFHQYKVHEAPNASECHQAYFRPYLSEEPWEDGEPGTVFPCDSVVLNNSYAHFNNTYKICKLEDVGNFIDNKIKMRFTPKEHCQGCVFTNNVNMLDRWKNLGESHFEEYKEPLKHEEFI